MAGRSASKGEGSCDNSGKSASVFSVINPLDRRERRGAVSEVKNTRAAHERFTNSL
jgi:hypothetical protein